ncbi:plexin domain-containing protein 2, partial [Asbolus verrucosus]
TLQTGPEIGQHYWIDLANRSDTKVSDILSKSHRRAATVQLSFEFPFYGHLIKNVTIATGGFLYTGDYVHSWLAATQYIAPLMANFDTSISNDSYIRYVDNGTAFTVEWEKVALRDKPNVGEFTFQTTLHKNGDIVFVYQNVPFFITSIEDDHHPVKVGLSDAYIIDRTVFRKFQNNRWTCQWCPSINRCSNGVDRNRQIWLTRGCEKKQVDNVTMCSHISGADIFDESNITYTHDVNEFQHQLEGYSKASSASALGPNHPVKMGVSSIMAILFLIAMVAGLAIWILYAYRNPHTTSGQILI